MPRKLTESAKEKQEAKKSRVVEEAKDLPAVTKQHMIEGLYRIGWTPKKIIEETKLPKSTVYDNIKRFAETGTCMSQQGKGGGQPASAVTKRNINRVRLMLWRNNELSMREIARRLDISERSVRRIIKKLNMKSYKIRRGQYLTEKHRMKRLELAEKMLKEVDKGCLPRIVFSDEKIFTVEPRVNRQNHRQILSKNKRGCRKTIGHSQFPASLMVWAAVCASGKSKLVFIERNIKINAAYYQSAILKKHLRPWAKKHFGRRRWIFQQDWAPAHGAKTTLQFCKRSLGRGRPWGRICGQHVRLISTRSITQSGDFCSSVLESGDSGVLKH